MGGASSPPQTQELVAPLTRYMVDSHSVINNPASKIYYTLESLLFFLENVDLSHSEYEKKAVEAAPAAAVVQLSDRTDLLAYLGGEISSSTNIVDDFIPAPADLPVPSEPVADDMEETSESSAATVESPAAIASVGEKLSERTDILACSNGVVSPSTRCHDDFLPEPVDTPFLLEPAIEAMETASDNVAATVEPATETVSNGKNLSDETNTWTHSNGEASSSTRTDDDFVPVPADFPVPSQPVTEAMEETSGGVPATAAPTTDSASNVEKTPAAENSSDFTWLLVSALHRLDDSEGSTVQDILWQVKQSCPVQPLVQTAKMRLKKLIPHLIREALAKNNIQAVPGAKPRRYKLASDVGPADFQEPSTLVPAFASKKRKVDADGLTKNQRKKLRKDAAAHVVDPVSAEDEVLDTVSADVLPRVPSADSKLLTATIIQSLRSLKGRGDSTADAVFAFAAGELQKVEAWPSLDVDMVRRVLDKGVEIGLLKKEGEEYYLIDAVKSHNGGTDRSPYGLLNGAETASPPALTQPVDGIPSTSRDPVKLQPADFIPAVILALYTNPAGLTLDEILVSLKKSFSEPLLNDATGMKMDQFVALTIGQALMKKEIQRANAASELPCRYKDNDKMSFHDFRSSSALNVLRLEKKPEIHKTDGVFREPGKKTPRLTSQTDQKRKNAEDGAKVDMVRAKMGSLTLAQREELWSLVDGALGFLEKADNCSMQTVYGSVVTLNQVRSGGAQYSFRDVQSMLRFGVKMGFYVLEGSWYRRVDEAKFDGVEADVEMEPDDQVVDHWEAERDTVENSIRHLNGVKDSPSVRKPKPATSSASFRTHRPSSVPQVVTSADSASPSTTVKAGFFKRQPKPVPVPLPPSSESVFPAAMLSCLVQDQCSASVPASSAAVISPRAVSSGETHEYAQLNPPPSDVRTETDGHTGSPEQSLVGEVAVPSGSLGFFKRQPNVMCDTPSIEVVSLATVYCQDTPVVTSASVDDISPASAAKNGFFKRQPNGTRASPSIAEAAPASALASSESPDVSPVSLVVPSTSSSSSSTKSGFFKRFCRTMPASATAPIT